MTENKIEPAIDILPDIRPATVEKNVNAAGGGRELDDLFSNLNAGQGTNAASIAAALVCLNVGSGSGDV